MKFQLFHYPGACSRVTLSGLEMTGAAYEVSVVILPTGPTANPPFSECNPLRQVPTLLIDGKPFTENLAILLMLHRLFPKAGIIPAGDVFANTMAIACLNFCASQLHPIVTRIMIPERFCDISEPASERVREQAVTMLLSRLATIEPVLHKRKWWVGNDLSIADIYLFWVTARMLRLSLDFSKLPGLAAHADRVRFSPLMTSVIMREVEFVAKIEKDGVDIPKISKVGMAL